ncbi:arsenate reductase (glutaredoxin) [Glaciecola sp. 1036]|uniref:arsenate reductase (glutaredoxin) n=1 Tax=Alteromonadaceae TaxID=72275 RepID=UPI003CFEED62
MPKFTLLHNPRCSKSRQALQIVEEKNHPLEVIEYLKSPLTEAQLNVLYTTLGVDTALEMIRPKEKEFIEAKLSKSSSDEEVIAAVAKFPKLLERPILIKGSLDKIEDAIIGRPPENVLDLF